MRYVCDGPVLAVLTQVGGVVQIEELRGSDALDDVLNGRSWSSARGVVEWLTGGLKTTCVRHPMPVYAKKETRTSFSFGSSFSFLLFFDAGRSSALGAFNWNTSIRI